MSATISNLVCGHWMLFFFCRCWKNQSGKDRTTSTQKDKYASSWSFNQICRHMKMMPWGHQFSEVFYIWRERLCRKAVVTVKKSVGYSYKDWKRPCLLYNTLLNQKPSWSLYLLGPYFVLITVKVNKQKTHAKIWNNKNKKARLIVIVQ